MLLFDQKMKLRLMIVSVLLKIKFRHTQIIVPKIGIPMLKTACINPWKHACPNMPNSK